MSLTITDLFCGAGGSSTGAIQVPGITVRVASNHWQLAVDTHNTNHQDADHICADLSQINPAYFPTSDILWASPECTNHSRAKGKKRTSTLQGDLFEERVPNEAAERSRATMWDVVRFTEHHRYQAIIVENVVEAAQWEPFRAWLLAMDSLGYGHQIVSLNSMHAQAYGMPAPQSRDRLYIVFHRKGNQRPDLQEMQRPSAYCPTCDEVVRSIQSWKRLDHNSAGRYGIRQQYVYRCPNVSCRNQVVEPGWLPAAAIIDWSIKGHRIGDRAKPLADKTRRRIAAGIARYWGPLQVETMNGYDASDPKHKRHGDPNSYYRAWPIDEPMRTMHGSESKALAIPVEGREGKVAQPMSAALRTQTTRLETALAVPVGGTWDDKSIPIHREPLRTQTTNDGTALVTRPFIAELRGGGSTARDTADPLATVTASGNHHALVTSYYGNNDSAKPASEALDTVTTVDRHALVMRNNSGGAEMVTPVREPVRTITTAGHQSVLTPGDIAAAEAQVDDVLFRMLEPHEVKGAMAFPGDYVILGNRREQVKMCGNAVTPPAARDLIAAVAASLGLKVAA
ncbi:DNA cytosine methyltransferase [Phycicoccus sp. 3266]|uniref:DNA cytosine methyltransferase n=1 Tax=Phycicoccus sp. 3266 TaxID=2817751 RepID=UPI00285A19B7|nr:DNA cytosine methyltransferase [Phycicoccus sp. 3266]MDR6861935.1 DNA (cytosine-5)-methyltransferase 1 [Phycicoccus sp. 3266]